MPNLDCLYSDEDAARFWDRVDTSSGLTECWPWTGSYQEFGYGWFWAQGKTRNAHRVAWELTFGPIPPTFQVMHACDNPPCVHPGHLMIGPNSANQLDMARKGRSTKGRFTGEQHPMAKLSASDVRDIRRRAAAGESYTAIAARYGVAQTTASAIARRLSWGTVE